MCQRPQTCEERVLRCATMDVSVRELRNHTARVIAAGVDVERFELVQPSLHRIFLDRVGAGNVEEGMTGHG